MRNQNNYLFKVTYIKWIQCQLFVACVVQGGKLLENHTWWIFDVLDRAWFYCVFYKTRSNVKSTNGGLDFHSEKVSYGQIYLFLMEKQWKGFSNFGIILSIKDSILRVWGLRRVTSGEMVVHPTSGAIGLVLNLEIDSVGIVMLSDTKNLRSGDPIVRMFDTLSINVDPLMLGNVFDVTGKLLNASNILCEKNLNFWLTEESGLMLSYVETKAPGIIDRQSVTEPLATGILGMDVALPLGQGQRELIIGDRQTGKTAVCVDIILNQAIVDMSILRYFDSLHTLKILNKYLK